MKTDHLRVSGTKHDKRVKLTDEDRSAIILAHQNGTMSINGLAREFNVSKRTIQFILFPERKERNVELREERGGTMRYYDKDAHRIAMQKHRDHKRSVKKELENVNIQAK